MRIVSAKRAPAFIAIIFCLSIAVASSAGSGYPNDAPWPSMRRDASNSGVAATLDFAPSTTPRDPIHFRTGNGIFSTPVIGAGDVVYVGSADHYFYALDPANGKELWKFDANEIIDSAACIGPDGTIYVPAGDAKLHALAPDGREEWAFDVLNNRAKKHFSFSTNYWFEANVVMGPDGFIYVANDDFFLYKLSTDGKLVWAYRTGMLIWSAAAFSPEGKIAYIAGFDMNLHALDAATGKLKWKVDLGNSLVGSTAVAPDGTLYQGTFGGEVYALDGKSGRIKWKMNTDGHVYASAAVAPDGVVYITSTDGALYALDPASGNVKWTFYIGDAIRSSPSVGVDPEKKSAYLVYFGGGDGSVYAIDPAGKMRWSYDTLVEALSDDYPNINASIALGKTGLATASANGDVIWLPYDYYLKPGAKGIKTSTPALPDGARWHYLTPGGHFVMTPIGGEPVEVNPAAVISLRLVNHKSGRLIPADISNTRLTVVTEPPFENRVEIQSDGSTVNIIPKELLKPGAEYSLKISASALFYHEAVKIDDVVKIKTSPTSGGDSIVSTLGVIYTITHMASPQPAIIPSLDQIGLASLSIPFTVVDVDEKKKSFVAYAVQRFGETETGEAVGVPEQRTLKYAFSGTYDGEYFLMESRDCLFEITSFAIPLDVFRLGGKLNPDRSVAKSASLLIEDYIGDTAPAFGSGGGAVSVSAAMKYLKKGGIEQFIKAGSKILPFGLKMSSRKIWIGWGLINEAKKMLGVGTFRMTGRPVMAEIISLEIKSFRYSPSTREAVAEIKIGDMDGRIPIIGIIAIDASTGKALPINYNAATTYWNTGKNEKKVTLSIPSHVQVAPGNLKLILLADLYELANRTY